MLSARDELLLHALSRKLSVAVNVRNGEPDMLACAEVAHSLATLARTRLLKAAASARSSVPANDRDRALDHLWAVPGGRPTVVLREILDLPSEKHSRCLLLLMSRPGELVAHDDILIGVGHPGRALVPGLRAALARYGIASAIENRIGKGYVMPTRAADRVDRLLISLLQ